MNVVARTASIALDLLPADELRKALLPPVRALREVAVSVAASVRHWELALEGGHHQHVENLDEQVARPPVPNREPDQVVGDALAEGRDDTWEALGGTPVIPSDDDLVDTSPAVLDSDDLPVQEWPQLSFAEAQARLREVDAQGLRDLIAYERQHGHRLQYTMLLEQRLDVLTTQSDA